MFNFKKAAAIALSAITLSSCLVLSSCGNQSGEEYPVRVANLTIEKEPEKIVALSDNAADILTAVGYGSKLEGRSDECTQQALAVVPSVGSKSNPNVNAVIGYGADVVFADTTLDRNAQSQLTEQGITVIKISSAQSKEELSVLYGSIGAIAGGNKTGREKAKNAFELLFDAAEQLSVNEGSSAVFTTCGYLYLDGDVLKTFPTDSFGDTVLKYTGAVNAASGATVAKINGSDDDDGTVDLQTLKRSNPTYIFCSDKETADYLKNNSVLKNLDAVKGNRLCEIAYDSMLRQGDSMIDNIKLMRETMFKTNSSQPATQPTSENVVDISTVADRYGITLKEGMELKLEDENDNVMALQKRLDDLGYMTVEPTGYFGELTVTAIKDFEKTNSMTQTGKANFETMTKIFSTDAKKRETPAREQ